MANVAGDLPDASIWTRPDSRWWLLSPWYRYRYFGVAGGKLTGAARPEDVEFRVYVVGLTWVVLAPGTGLVMVGVAYIAHLIYGETGNKIALSILAGLTGFCLTGAVDSIWRYFPAHAAVRLSIEHDYERTPEVIALLRAAMKNDGILLIQLLVAIAVTVAVASGIGA